MHRTLLIRLHFPYGSLFPLWWLIWVGAWYLLALLLVNLLQICLPVGFLVHGEIHVLVCLQHLLRVSSDIWSGDT